MQRYAWSISYPDNASIRSEGGGLPRAIRVDLVLQVRKLPRRACPRARRRSAEAAREKRCKRKARRRMARPAPISGGSTDWRLLKNIRTTGPCPVPIGAAAWPAVSGSMSGTGLAPSCIPSGSSPALASPNDVQPAEIDRFDRGYPECYKPHISDKLLQLKSWETSTFEYPRNSS